MTTLLLLLVAAGITATTTPGTHTPLATHTNTSVALSPIGTDIIDSVGGFSVTLPEGFSEPKREETPVPSALGELTMVSYSSTSISSGQVLVGMVGYSVYPEIAFSGQTQKQMYDNARKGALQNTGGKLLKETSYTLDGYKARSILVGMKKGGQQMYARFDYVAISPCLVFFALVSPDKKQLDSPTSKSFYSSIKLRH